MSEPLVLVERDPPVATVLLNRPKQLNALSDALMDELVDALRELDADAEIRCIVLGGSERAFAAGADIGELARASAIELYYGRRIERWDSIRALWTPLVAAVSGFCLGGGCELAMSCDLIVASETARFGQPETGLGIIPGAGGTQLLTRAVGKAVAMDVILTGRMLTAREALARRARRPRGRARGVARGGQARRPRHRLQGAGGEPPCQGGRRPSLRGPTPARARVRAAGCCTSPSPRRTRARG